MINSSRWNLIFWIVCFALLDQGSKWLAKAYLSPGVSVPIIPGVFQLSLAFNTGAAFSLLRHQPQLLSAFTSVLFIVLLTYALSRRQLAKGEPLAMALILGGALGNLVDRLTTGRVTDYFDVVAIHYPIFNVADSFIFVGVILMIVTVFRSAPANDSTAGTNAHEPPAQS
ncbi:signal peptidase II [Vampirovibrio chlorellavorus]|uniref:signal peptidase II n=1 Tax=Vampirovibrio chlorellavorus TaxID=758823 RepID=UPI0026EA3733|nr:signal peptidase II [Vampirovibrio chlorellavorus]